MSVTPSTKKDYLDLVPPTEIPSEAQEALENRRRVVRIREITAAMQENSQQMEEGLNRMESELESIGNRLKSLDKQSKKKEKNIRLFLVVFISFLIIVAIVSLTLHFLKLT